MKLIESRESQLQTWNRHSFGCVYEKTCRKEGLFLSCPIERPHFSNREALSQAWQNLQKWLERDERCESRWQKFSGCRRVTKIKIYSCESQLSKEEELNIEISK